jgi:RHH-type proline utilization regulon transcriptional repressor/proline dehydrogenase/delta 1-pyrroline-5-carboxylate dehydrogenase
VLRLVDVEEGPVGERLIAHPAVDRVILTGAYETAELFRSWRHDLPLLAETSGKNAIIVTPSADLDLAVADVVKSAFGHAGQKCSAASLVILVGSVARSQRFRRQLVDAVRTLHVGPAWDPETHMGPIIEPAGAKLLAGLTRLGLAESWLVKPELLRGDTYWSPGVRDGVLANSEFHLTEYFGPVLGIMSAGTLDEAIRLQNAPAYGLTAGLHSLDPAEIDHWLETVQAGNLYVNRGTTGAIVRRQPFGGWKRSTVGTGTKAGGVNYLMALGSWRGIAARQGDDLGLEGVSDRVARLVEAAQSGLGFDEFDAVRRSARSDERAWLDEYGISRDVSELGVERNVLRYRPVAAVIRLTEGRPLGELVRVMAAAARAGSSVRISSALPLPTPLVDLLVSPLAPLTVTDLTVETDAAFTSRARGGALGGTRVRLLGESAAHTLAAAISGAPDVAIFSGEVTASGRVELLPFLREQAIALTAHRFGNPDPRLADLVI